MSPISGHKVVNPGILCSLRVAVGMLETVCLEFHPPTSVFLEVLEGIRCWTGSCWGKPLVEQLSAIRVGPICIGAILKCSAGSRDDGILKANASSRLGRTTPCDPEDWTCWVFAEKGCEMSDGKGRL